MNIKQRKQANSVNKSQMKLTYNNNNQEVPFKEGAIVRIKLENIL